MGIKVDGEIVAQLRRLSNNEEEFEGLINKILRDWLELTPAQHKGKEAEERIRSVLHNHRDELNIRSISQYDIVLETNDGVTIMVEVKKQEYFKSPPFDGHGLPKWQVEKYLRQQKKAGMRVLLLVIDPDKNCIYKQWLDVLEESGNDNIFDTRGKSPRRVYRLENFDCLEFSAGMSGFIDWFKDALSGNSLAERLRVIFGESETTQKEQGINSDDDIPF